MSKTKKPALDIVQKAGLLLPGETLTDFVRLLQARLNLNNTDLAAKVGVSATVVGSWLSGKFDPSTVNVQRLLTLLADSGKPLRPTADPAHPLPETPAPEFNPEIDTWLREHPADASELGAEGRDWLMRTRFTGGHAAYTHVPMLVAKFRRMRDASDKVKSLMESPYATTVEQVLDGLTRLWLGR